METISAFVLDKQKTRSMTHDYWITELSESVEFSLYSSPTTSLLDLKELKEREGTDRNTTSCDPNKMFVTTQDSS